MKNEKSMKKIKELEKEVDKKNADYIQVINQKQTIKKGDPIDVLNWVSKLLNTYK